MDAGCRAMRRLVTGLALLAAILWTVLVWGGYAFIGWGGKLLAGNLGLLVQPPELEAYADWVRFLIVNLGWAAALVLWVLGIGLIWIAQLVASFILGRLAPPPRPVVQPPLPPAGLVEPPPAAPAAAGWGREASGR